MKWRVVESSEELTAFAVGKTILRFGCSEFGSEAIFTDGTAIRCDVEAGTVYSEHSADSATIVWEVYGPDA